MTHFDQTSGRVDTDCGPATLELLWLSARAVRIVFHPPLGVDEFGDAWALAPGERIYGMSERLTDSRPLNNVPGILQIDEINPRAVGSLDRRGEKIEMLVQGTVGVYAPFYQSSAGYGLYVEGTAVGAYDVGASDPDALDFTFAAGSTPASQTLRYVLFAGTPARSSTPTPRSPAGRSSRRRGRSSTGAGATSTRRAHGRVDGEAINAQVAEDLTMYERSTSRPAST